MESDDKQGKLRLPFGVVREPKEAPIKVVRQLESEAQAVAVCMEAKGLKLAYVAAALGRSEGYISRIRSGHRRVPKWFVDPFCALVGSRLLRQYRDMTDILEDTDHLRIGRLASMLLEAA